MFFIILIPIYDEASAWGEALQYLPTHPERY
jgi:hypothetical protein